MSGPKPGEYTISQPGDSQSFLSIIGERFANANRRSELESNLADLAFNSALNTNKFVLELANPTLETNWQGTEEILEWDVNQMNEIPDMGLPTMNGVRKKSRAFQMKLFAKGAQMSIRLAKDLANNTLFAQHFAKSVRSVMASLALTMKSSVISTIMAQAMTIGDFSSRLFPYEASNFSTVMNKWNKNIGVLNKGDNAITQLISSTATMFQANSGIFNSLIVCPETSNLPALSAYFSDGSKVGTNISNDVVFNGGSRAFGRYAAIQNVYEAGVSWRPRNAVEARNPMTTDQELGLFYVMADNISDSYTYHPNQRDIGVFDPVYNNFVRISFLDTIPHCINWEAGGNWNNAIVDLTGHATWDDYLNTYSGGAAPKRALPVAPPPIVIPGPPAPAPPAPVPIYQNLAVDPFVRLRVSEAADLQFEVRNNAGIVAGGIFDRHYPALSFFSDAQRAAFYTLLHRTAIAVLPPTPAGDVVSLALQTLLGGTYVNVTPINQMGRTAVVAARAAAVAAVPGAPTAAEIAAVEATMAPVDNIAVDPDLNDAHRLLLEATTGLAAIEDDFAVRAATRNAQPEFRAKAQAFYDTGNFSKAQALIGSIIASRDASFGVRQLQSIFPEKSEQPAHLEDCLVGVRQLSDTTPGEVVSLATHAQLQTDVFGLPYPAQEPQPAAAAATAVYPLTRDGAVALAKAASPPFKIVILHPRVAYQGNALVFIQNGGQAVQLLYGKTLATLGLNSQAQVGDIALSMPLTTVVREQLNMCVFPSAQIRRMMGSDTGFRWVDAQSGLLNKLRTNVGYRELKSNDLIAIILPDHEKLPGHICLQEFESVVALEGAANRTAFNASQPNWITRLRTFLNMRNKYDLDSPTINVICSQATHLCADHRGNLRLKTVGLDGFGDALTYDGATDARECGISSAEKHASQYKPLPREYQ